MTEIFPQEVAGKAKHNSLTVPVRVLVWGIFFFNS